MVIDVLLLLTAFLAGSVPFSWIVGRRRAGLDLREEGDRNVGSGNLMAVAGMGTGLVALVLDVLKGALAVGLPAALGRDEWVLMSAAVAVVAGHVISPWLLFAGGRGAAAAIGAGFALFPGPGGVMLGPALLVLLLTRNTALAIAAFVIGLVAIVLVEGDSLGRLMFVALLFIAVGLKDAWDRAQRRRALSVSEPARRA